MGGGCFTLKAAAYLKNQEVTHQGPRKVIFDIMLQVGLSYEL